MAKDPVGRYLSPQLNKADNRWDRLYRQAVRIAQENDDDRIKLLKSHAHQKEHILRAMSIVSEQDLNREF
jgi:hypothetical protein